MRRRALDELVESLILMGLVLIILNRTVDNDRFVITKNSFTKHLNNCIPLDTDLKIDYRTVRGNHGKTFHDRYLILKYGINKCRVWSLGISVNSLGKSHHIIQIVETPSAVAGIFDEIWKETDYEECKIYSN